MKLSLIINTGMRWPAISGVTLYYDRDTCVVPIEILQSSKPGWYEHAFNIMKPYPQIAAVHSYKQKNKFLCSQACF